MRAFPLRCKEGAMTEPNERFMILLDVDHVLSLDEVTRLGLESIAG